MKTCEHLRPLEQALAERGIELRPMRSPCGDGDRWFECRCTFEAEALSARLSLGAPVRYDEYDGRTAGSEATFACEACHCVIMGLHPRYVPPGTPRVA